MSKIEPPTALFGTAIQLDFLVKIPALHLQRIDMKIRYEHVARGYNRLRLVPWIRPSASGELIAASWRQFELL
ncbi:hypothetical protein, partial [Rhizobium leguminosarum]|uniref:hypothetical protein n=1 Tax=Rhizobium leguminosarum TaxID=384 RepID=UPI001C961E6F